VRLLFLTLLVAFGFVAAAADPRGVARERQVADTVWQQHGAAGFDERAPPLFAPVHLTVRSGHSSPPSRLPDGAGGVVGSGQYSSMLPRHVAARRSTEASRIDERDRRRQPEGRGPPRRPTTA
jgi:hypothetical protein